ncbi:hypothetical protein GCM10009765_03210 [Fodinicola feengrottensis]|uniref:Uncharacterized protein n=1 Tax=Fodinicola feengrottensis TaxID=435914 RepID=A0ABN2FS97_9ACTN
MAVHLPASRTGSAVFTGNVTVPFWTKRFLKANDKTVNPGTKLTQQARIHYARDVTAWARAMSADEISVQQFPVPDDPNDRKVWDGTEVGRDPYEIRIWWD